MAGDRAAGGWREPDPSRVGWGVCRSRRMGYFVPGSAFRNSGRLLMSTLASFPMPSDPLPVAGPESDFDRELPMVVAGSWATALRLCRNPEEAEDLLQDAALLALRGRASFQPGSNLRGWYYRILVNQFYTRLRRRKREPTAPAGEDWDENVAEGDVIGAPWSVADLADTVMDRIDADLIRAELDALPEVYRVAAVLHFSQDLSYREIAGALDVPIGTVRSRLHRARFLLQARLRGMAEARGLLHPVVPQPVSGACRLMMSQLDDYLDRELTPRDCEVIDRHLEKCDRCRSELAARTTFQGLLKRALERIPCPEHLRDRIMGRLRGGDHPGVPA